MVPMVMHFVVVRSQNCLRTSGDTANNSQTGMLILHSKRRCTKHLSASLSLSANEYLYCAEEDEDEVAVDDADSIVDVTEGALAVSLDLPTKVVDMEGAFQFLVLSLSLMSLGLLEKQSPLHL
jgi:hypothetical protein